MLLVIMILYILKIENRSKFKKGREISNEERNNLYFIDNWGNFNT